MEACQEFVRTVRSKLEHTRAMGVHREAGIPTGGRSYANNPSIWLSVLRDG